jgi:hypothetical protein
MNKIAEYLFSKVMEKGKQVASEIADNVTGKIKEKIEEKSDDLIDSALDKIKIPKKSLETDEKAEISENLEIVCVEAETTNTEVVLDSDASEEKKLVDYADGEAFEKNLRGDLMDMTTSLAAGNPEAAKKVLNSFVTMAGEVHKFTEVQKTKRKEIEAERDTQIEKLKSQKEIILFYLEKSFDERKENFSHLFSVVDSAIENNNMQQLALALDSINKLADSSPFKALASIKDTKKGLEDKNHEWDF